MASPDNQSSASRSSGTSGLGSSGIVQQATSTVSDIAQQATDRVRDQASKAADQAQDRAQAFLSEQKEAAAGHIDGVVKVLHDTVDQLRERSPGAVTDYAERAVDSLDSVANALREQDVRALVGQVEDFARRQPALFLAGTVAIGFALARFLKSSSRSAGGYGQQSQNSSGYGSGERRYDGSSGYQSSSSRASSGRSDQSSTEYARHIAADTNRGGGAPTAGRSGFDHQGSGSKASSASTGQGRPSNGPESH